MALGWRMTFIVIGLSWAVFGVLELLIVKEPTRGQFVFLPKSANNEQPSLPFWSNLFNAYAKLTKISSIRWNLLGIFFRFWGYACLLAFQFSWFGYFRQPQKFSYGTIVIMLTGGVISNILAASISQKWSLKDPKGLALVPAIMCFFASITAFFIFSSQSLLVAMIFYGVYFTLGDGFVAPVLSMFSIAAPPDCKGQVMGYFITVVSISTLVMPLVVSAMIGADTTHEHMTFVFMINTIIPNAVGGICFLIASFGFADEVHQQ
jgi:hypothetical protein